MSFLYSFEKPNGDITTIVNVYECDITGEKILDCDPHLSINGKHISYDCIDLIMEAFIDDYNRCPFEKSHILLLKLFRRNRPNRYVHPSVKKQLLEMYSYMCAICNSKETLQIDHIHPISKGGSNEINNLQVLCSKCNRKKSNKCLNNDNII